MTHAFSLVSVLTVLAASACSWSIVPEALGKTRKMWRLGVPPALATLVALLLLAGAVTTFVHDATWTATALVGAAGGMLRVRSVGVQTDQVWGLVRPQPVLDGVLIPIAVVGAALVDAIANFLPQDTLPRQAHCSRAISRAAPGPSPFAPRIRRTST